jgi:hypothetical protein
VLHTGRVDGFCLVSSDSDFTRLSTRIREAGLVVYGFGERKTPEPCVAACDKFIYTEILRTEPEEAKPLLVNALNAIAPEDGWTTLSALGSQITRSNPAFDPRNYGVAKLAELIRLKANWLAAPAEYAQAAINSGVIGLPAASREMHKAGYKHGNIRHPAHAGTAPSLPSPAQRTPIHMRVGQRGPVRRAG